MVEPSLPQLEAMIDLMKLNNPNDSKIKRLIDFSVSGLLLIIFSPLLLFISILIKLTSRGPILYRWEVVGFNNRDIESYKFRSMTEGADNHKDELEKYNKMKGPVFKMKNDPRVTPMGKFLRKYSLDELPQLYSVLKGDLSLVGPRPPSRKEYEQFKPWQKRKLSVKPGITCLWQVNGRNKIVNFDEWVKLDLEYIDNWSLWLDFKILLKTVAAVVKGTGE